MIGSGSFSAAVMSWRVMLLNTPVVSADCFSSFIAVGRSMMPSPYAAPTVSPTFLAIDAFSLSLSCQHGLNWGLNPAGGALPVTERCRQSMIRLTGARRSLSCRALIES